jgi:hypothetical protein
MNAGAVQKDMEMMLLAPTLVRADHVDRSTFGWRPPPPVVTHIWSLTPNGKTR